MSKKIIDVSHWQGKINWKKAAADGVKGVIIKITEGSEAGDAFVDGHAKRNYKQARKQGLLVGFYHYAKFVSVKDAKEEADWFIKHVRKHKKFTIVPMLDLEENNCKTVKEMNKAARAFLERVEDRLGSAGLYSFGNFFEDNVDKVLLKDYAYWHARYNDDPVNVKLKDIYLWQYASDGSVDGISGNVDMNKIGSKFFTVNVKKGKKKTNKKVKKKSNTKKKSNKIKGKTYKVKSGDNLSQIASNTGVSMNNLVKWNNIKDKNHIIPGQKLRLKAPKKKNGPKSKSGKYGKLKIINVGNAAIVMNKPDRNNSSNLGSVKKGKKLPLNGSVSGSNNPGGYWEVQYKGKLGYITAKFGQHVK